VTEVGFDIPSTYVPKSESKRISPITTNSSVFSIIQATTIMTTIMTTAITIRRNDADPDKNRNGSDYNGRDGRGKRERGRRRSARGQSPNASQSRANRNKDPRTGKEGGGVEARGRAGGWVGWGRGPGMVKRKAKGTKRGLKGPEQPANPDEGTIAEVW